MCTKFHGIATRRRTKLSCHSTSLRLCHSHTIIGAHECDRIMKYLIQTVILYLYESANKRRLRRITKRDKYIVELFVSHSLNATVAVVLRFKCMHTHRHTLGWYGASNLFVSLSMFYSFYLPCQMRFLVEEKNSRNCHEIRILNHPCNLN